MGVESVSTSSPVLTDWNTLARPAAAARILPCCGSEAWAASLAARRPFRNEQSLLAASKNIWESLTPADWQQAFDSHPRIGEQNPRAASTALSEAWSGAEQRTAMAARRPEKDALRSANAAYEQRFGRIFIICAQDRSAQAILNEFHRRLNNSPEKELLEAAREQQRITELRLRRWLEMR